jgi:hypothetical protein
VKTLKPLLVVTAVTVPLMVCGARVIVVARGPWVGEPEG